MTRSLKQVAALLVALLCLDPHGHGGFSAPICMHGPTGCHVPSLADLFDRVIQHSARMHSLSNDLHSEFEQYFLPSKNHIGKIYRKCHTANILTPNGKENAQKLAREELTEVILKLLMAWRDPLFQLHQSMAHQQDFNSFSSNKALEMGDMAHELRKGVEKIAEKMRVLGMLGNAVPALSSQEALVAVSDSGEAMSDYELLYCFRRDSNKVQNYLKILKCRIVTEHDC
ncbi:prolactin 2 [Misgurnus anguillicaudatus]|uniref:prolactin 2 n=1 Tax=Misgurnus anguillicaudatus TaxID=75329 RepID=UPI0024356860|nr:prolactin 2 [Misgurnus anguillicaudatus]